MAKFSKPLVICSFIGASFGGAILVKEFLGGDPYNSIKNASDKIIIVTGATSGIGRATTLALAKLNAKVIMACRDNSKCEQVRESIVMETKNKYIYCRKCDLASKQSIRDFVEKFKNEHKRLDVLINNAGVMNCPKEVTEDGIEMQLGVNHMGHFLLTNLLLDKLKESAPSRIVVLSDIAYRKGEIHKEDLNLDKSYIPEVAYRQSKLANMMFVKELDKRLKGTNVTVNAVNPGVVDTDLVRHMSYYKSVLSLLFVKPIMWPFIKSPRQGALPVLYVALDPGLENVSGKCFKYKEEEEISEIALDNKVSYWLWLTSEKWTELNR
ncbi:retinol dehydrogenase 13-like isoform X2 [Lycorma delicatula]|uniref:retinol dehydrogenase 13-like isoform X2 n=1 Tax=Lycorma delicatula TaxID=130591 RepID=UPI003F50ECD7